MARVKRGVTAHAKHKKVIKAAKGYYERVSSVLEPFTAIKAIVFSPAGLSVLAIAVAAGIGFYAWRIRNAQVEAYREGSV